MPFIRLCLVIGLLGLAGTSLAEDASNRWSKPVNGLQARFGFARKKTVNGTPVVATYLELRNVSDVGNVMEIPLSRARVSFRVTDSKGKVVEPAYSPYSGPAFSLHDLRMPLDSALRYNISCGGAGIPKDHAAHLDLGPDYHWNFRRDDDQTYFLQATLTIGQSKSRHWFGTIEIPSAQISTTAVKDESAGAQKGEN